MPVQKEPETYDQYVGVALMNEARMNGKTQADLAAVVGISERTFSRRMGGEPGFTVYEIEALSRFMGSEPGRILQNALDAFGGIEKLLSEVRGSTDSQAGDDDWGPVPILSRKQSEAVTPTRKAARRGSKEDQE